MMAPSPLSAEEVLAVGIVCVLLTCVLVLGVWVLARRERMCLHPFELAFHNQRMWRCPRCGDEFHKQKATGQWRLFHKQKATDQWRLLIETTTKE